jgi:hypothetical protein
MKLFMLRKNLEAWIRGYFYYRVTISFNEFNKTNYFWIYSNALLYKNNVVNRKCDIEFEGKHIFKGWLGFFYQLTCGVRKSRSYNVYHD